MTESIARDQPVSTGAMASNHLRRRRAAERRFRCYGVAAIALALLFLLAIFAAIGHSGYSAFRQTEMRLDINLDAQVIDPEGTRDLDGIARADFAGLVKRALRQQFPQATKRRDKRALAKLVSIGAAYDVQKMVLADPALIGTVQSIWLPASDDVDMYLKGAIKSDAPEAARRLNDRQIGWIEGLRGMGRLELRFNTRFFTSGDSREPELAGIWGAIVGSFLTLAVTVVLAFPLGVMTAVYLEEFAPKNRWTEIIEVNINNLAAVPSIVFGLLGLAVFLGVLGMPRSAPVAGGMVLALMTLPTIIIAARVALQAVPPSIREAALGMGASQFQTVAHHVLPLALPGVLTGTIIGMARALGETAPLLMIGMVAFIVDIPSGPTDAATVLPVQIYLWADSPERAFVERTSAAIIVLLLFLITMNLMAVILRKKFEKRW